MPASTAASEDAPAKENRRDDRCRQCSPKGKPVLLHDMLPYAREHSSLSVGSCGKKTRWAFLTAFMRAEQNFPDPGRFSDRRTGCSVLLTHYCAKFAASIRARKSTVGLPLASGGEYGRAQA